MNNSNHENYRLINLKLIGSGGSGNFDIYHKTSSLRSVFYQKLADTTIEQNDKVKQHLESGDPSEEFFIKKEDLHKYQKNATQILREIAVDSNIAFQEKSKIVYDVSKSIMKEFFEHNASNEILRSSEAVMDIMQECFRNSKSEFFSITQITHKDYSTYTHSVNVGLYCMTYGVKAGLSTNDIRELGLGGMLHDVGKSKVSPEILDKNGFLTDEEFEEAKKHAPYGGELLFDMNCYGQNVVDMANQHHEKFKGGGYPEELAGEEISYFSRICKVMDVYDALTSRRTYRNLANPFDTLSLMKRNMADEFDPAILNNFIKFMGPEQ
jgi:HD-GYP domain-containing protein (c-di-GMP phosphodiesterase class II)